MTLGVENRSSPARAPESGQLARVRGRIWVVGEVERDSQASLDNRPVQHLVRLISVEDDATGEELEVVWEIEPGTSVIERAELPAIAADRLDEPAELDAFLDAVRWGAVTSADHRSLQAPFRSGVVIEDCQLEPLVRALRSPRTNLLIADDVGLGKTIEAGLVVQELLLRHRARTALVVCPASLQLQWRDEMREKFGLEFRIVDRELLGQLRRTRGVGANPFAHFPRLTVSIDWLKGDLGMRLLREVLPPHPEIPRRYDVLIVDEVHNGQKRSQHAAKAPARGSRPRMRSISRASIAMASSNPVRRHSSRRSHQRSLTQRRPSGKSLTCGLRRGWRSGELPCVGLRERLACGDPAGLACGVELMELE